MSKTLSSFTTSISAQVSRSASTHRDIRASLTLPTDNIYRLQVRSSKLTTTGYHSDVSYEHQPPALTILTLLEVPATGGDTAWVSQVAAYERLSAPIQKLLEGLTAEHDGFRQAEGARRDGKFVRREPVTSEHPIVRVHPVSQSSLDLFPGAPPLTRTS